MISTEEQLRAAAERLGVQAEDLQSLFPTRFNLSAPGYSRDSDSLTTDTTSLFRTEAINNALDESLFAICERAFRDSPSQVTSFSPAHSSLLSSGRLNSTQRPDNNSAASASSSAAAALAITHIQSNSISNSKILTVPHKTTETSGDDFTRKTVRTTKIHRDDEQAGLSQTIVTKGSGKESSPQTQSPIHLSPQSRSQSPPTTAIGCILSFAHGQQLSLVDVSDLEERSALRKIQSLSIIPGCDNYSECCIFSYIGALFKAHLDLVENLSGDQNSFTPENIDDLKSEVKDTSWRAIFLGEQAAPAVERLAGNYPPMIASSMDLFQFSYRLVQKMSKVGDSLANAFLEGLYSSSTPKIVASVTTRLLSIWADVWRKGEFFQRQSLLLEWCIRLLGDFIVFELSPVSQVRLMKNFSHESFVVFNLGKEGLPSLPIVIDYCFQFVLSHQVGKECKLAFCELAQAYLIWSRGLSPKGSVQAALWTEAQEATQDYVNSFVAKEGFWITVVQPTLQHVKKLPQLSNSCVEYTFLSSLVSLSSAKRALFDDKQDKSKWMLLNMMIRNLELMNRDLLSCFMEAEETQNSFPGIHSSVEFVYGLIASAAVQREVLSADPATKSRFLSSLESLIANSAKVIRYYPKVDEVMEYVQKGPFGKIVFENVQSFESDSERRDLCEEAKKENAQMKTTGQVLAHEKAVAFAAKLIGCLGKSVEDGSWDMSQMNSIKALFHARINSSRTRRRLWNDIYKIQRCVEKKIGTEELLSTSERGSFAMVVEVVRKHVVCDSTDRSVDFSAQDNSVEPQAIVTASGARDIKACLPPVWDILELQHSVCSSAGYTNFDNNHDMLMFMKDVLTERGQQMLARYDLDSPFTFKWIRLQKRNAYIGRARDLLDKSDRTVGQLCSCVPGYPKENRNGNENRVACSNDLCENRHMKIECVPGKCGAGTYCMNQRMQNLDYAKFKMVQFPGKGVGMVADEDIPEGALVGEYQGEVVTMDEYERRVQEYEGERHFYFMTLTGKLVIDASRKSQATRFLNHSCDPNSETQKWNADGEPRVGVFAKRLIPKGEEITFDYGARSLTQYSASCLCGAKNCRKFLAVRKEEIVTPKDSDREGSTKDNDFVETVEEDALKNSTGKQRCVLEDDRRSSIVKEKIEIAKEYLREADALSKKAEESLQYSHDCSFSDDMRQKLKFWKASLQREANIMAIPENLFEETSNEVRFPRIPRRTAISAQNDKRTTERSHDESTERNNSSRQIATSREADSVAVTQDVRSSMTNRRAPSAGRWALFEEACAGKLGDSRNSLKRPAEGDSVRRVSKVPRTGFLPTTSKLKKQPLRPRFAKRRRTREQDENDSMGDYSTASEAEPILDEPVTSPSRLPDGSGACSDDEFVAAPPVESLRFSPTARKWDRSDHERRRYVERAMNQSEFNREGEQTREGQRSRLGSSLRPAWNKSKPALQPHIRAGHGVQSPRTYEHFRAMKADARDVVAHETDPSESMADHRRYPEYHPKSSPPREGYRELHSRKVEHRQQVYPSEDISDCDQHPSRQVVRTRRLRGHNADNNAYLASRHGFPQAVEVPTFPDGKERKYTGEFSPARHEAEDQDRARIGAKVIDNPISNMLERANVDLRSYQRAKTECRPSRRKEGTKRSFHGDGHVSLDKPRREKYGSDRFFRAFSSQSAGSLELRPHGDHRLTGHPDEETHWPRRVEPRLEQKPRGDLRTMITGRTQNKIR